MSVQAALLPVFVLVALTFVLLVLLGRSRVAAIRAGEVRIADIMLGERRWPSRPAQVSNAFDNQFQIPLLFYVLVVLAIITRKADLIFVVMEWVFVVTRLVHAYIHAGSNRLKYRFAAYALGVLILAIMWLVFAIRILTTL